MLYKTAIILLALLMVTAVFVVISQTQQAKATTPTQWETVRGYIDSFYGGSQSGGGLNGEAGFRMGKVDLWNRLDSNGDISPNYGLSPAVAPLVPAGPVTGVLGEGDNAANRPVLIDNLGASQTTIIPGTEFRCTWSTDQSCFADSSITAIRQIVDNHKAAGFSTDIVDYCVSSQTAGPSSAGFGIIAQVPGALASDTSLTPNVYILDYSRNGWRNNLSNAPGAESILSPETSAGGYAAPGTPPGTVAPAACDALSGLALVECSANWAISLTGGNVGNGQGTIATIAAAGQSVDVRSGTINTMNTATTTNNNLQVPISTLFSTSGLANLDPLKTTVVAGRTQMGQTGAIGLKMLGYSMITGGSISGGISHWQGTEGEQQAFYGPALPLQAIATSATPVVLDATGPSVSSVGAVNVTASSADINRVAGEPATMKVEYGTVSGVYTNTVNNTVLNANKTVPLSGLNGGTTYYYRVTSYDGQANGTVSAEGSFTTVAACTPAKPTLTLSNTSTYWASYADYTARLLSINWTISNTGSNGATNVAITGSTNTNGVTISTALPASVGSIGAGSSAMITLVYNVPLTTGSWHTSTTASADDDCGGTGYTYP